MSAGGRPTIIFVVLDAVAGGVAVLIGATVVSLVLVPLVPLWFALHRVRLARLGSATGGVRRRHTAAIDARALRGECVARGARDIFPVSAPLEGEALRRPVVERLDLVRSPR